MNRQVARSFVILGQTRSGKPFRPSDWAERLCGIMATFRPGTGGPQAHLSYSPWVVPGQRGEIKCVLVDGAINLSEPMAYDFLVGFARDNDLLIDGEPGV